MKEIKNILFSLGLLLSLGSCTLTKYFPSPVTTPLLSEKNELRITAGVPGNVSIAYSPAENFGITASTSFTSETITKTEREQVGNHFIVETAIGYYKKEEGKNFMAEIYGGVGLGSFNVKEQNSGTHFKFNIPTTKIFISPSVGWKRKGFESAFTLRFTGLEFGRYSTNYSLDDLTINGFDELNRGMTFFTEPALLFRFGMENLKFELQSGFSIPINKREIYNYSPFYGSVGISLNLPKGSLKKAQNQ